MLNIRTLKIDSVYLQLLINLFILLIICWSLVGCSNNSTDTVNSKKESEGFVLQLETKEQFKENEKLTFRVGVYQEFSDELIYVNYISHLIDLKILDSDDNELYTIGYEDRVYEGTIGNDKSVLNTLLITDPNLKTLPKGEYTVRISSTFIYNEKEVVLELSKNIIVK